jgi:hypothetical protein
MRAISPYIILLCFKWLSCLGIGSRRSTTVLRSSGYSSRPLRPLSVQNSSPSEKTFQELNEFIRTQM